MRRPFWTAILALFLAAAGQAQESDQNHIRIYQKVYRSVVGIRCLAPLGERSGTGVILNADGLILTSYAVVPDGAKKIRVWTSGPRFYADASLVATSEKDELSLLRIAPQFPLTPIPMGRSERVNMGDTTYTIGNAANAIILNDQPAFHVGIVSALYLLRDRRANSTYRGMVLETTAAVNVGMEGAPLLNAAGEMIGCVTLNYSPHRFLGCAIPIDAQTFVISRLLAENRNPEDDPDPGEAFLGLKTKLENGKVVITDVAPNGSAARAGLEPGDIILSIGRTPIQTPEDLRKHLVGLHPGDVLWLMLEGVGEVKIVLKAKE